jgi:hypothetical protein
MAIPASEDKTMPDARHKHLRDRPNSAGSKIYARSSATEMQAILISDDGVRSAIGDFETYISNALDKTLTDEHGRRGAGFSDAEWDQKLLELVEKMVDEQKVDRGEGRRGKRPSYF